MAMDVSISSTSSAGLDLGGVQEGLLTVDHGDAFGFERSENGDFSDIETDGFIGNTQFPQIGS